MDRQDIKGLSGSDLEYLWLCHREGATAIETRKELSRAQDRFTESVIREMTRLSDLEGAVNLAQGFPDFPAPHNLKEAAMLAVKEDLNQYPTTFGELRLRTAISEKVKRHNSIEADPETEITVTCGATEAMIATLKALINPGDDVVIFEPFYENYGPDTILSGARPRYVKLNPPDWTFDTKDLRDAFNENTKGIIVNSPHNPTGKVFSRQEIVEISALCQKWGAYVITDEVYEHILYDNNRHISPVTVPGLEDRTVTISSASKTYSVTGWRIGWSIAPPYLTAAIRKVHDFLTVGAPTPLQHAVVAGLSLSDSYYSDLCQRYARAREHLYETLISLGFEVSRPMGAYYFMAGIARVKGKIGAADDDDFCRRLIRLGKVATVPGRSFYSSEDRSTERVRFCFSKSMETLDEVRRNLSFLAE